MSYSKIPAGKDLPNDIYVAIEIPANHAPIKYEIDTVIPSTCWS
jgi:inorganic pyrophosphatase